MLWDWAGMYLFIGVKCQGRRNSDSLSMRAAYRKTPAADGNGRVCLSLASVFVTLVSLNWSVLTMSLTRPCPCLHNASKNEKMKNFSPPGMAKTQWQLKNFSKPWNNIYFRLVITTFLDMRFVLFQKSQTYTYFKLQCSRIEKTSRISLQNPWRQGIQELKAKA